jgi:hypothetical protein
MISFTSIRSCWNHFFYEDVDPTVISLFRVIMGLFLFTNGLSLLPDWELWLGVGSNSLVPLSDSITFYHGFRINLFEWMTPTDQSALLILILFIVSSFFVLIGFQTRIFLILTFLLLVSIQNRNFTILNSGDTLLRCLLFPLIFSPAQFRFSVDSILRKKSQTPYPERTPVTALRLLQLQFTLVYFATVLFKLKGHDWVDGTAVYYTSRLENFQRIILPVVFEEKNFIKIMTWSALFIEFSLATLIWIREMRKWVLMAGLLLHLGIELTMSIGCFEWLMMGAYVLFLDASDVKRFLSFLIPQNIRNPLARISNLF